MCIMSGVDQHGFGVPPHEWFAPVGLSRLPYLRELHSALCSSEWKWPGERLCSFHFVCLALSSEYVCIFYFYFFVK